MKSILMIPMNKKKKTIFSALLKIVFLLSIEQEKERCSLLLNIKVMNYQILFTLN